MELFLALLDQFRYMAGTLAMLLIMCRRALPRRDQFAARLGIGAGVCFLLAFAYVPFWRWVQPWFLEWPIIVAPYWFLMSFAAIWFVMFCYETSWAEALFRTLLAVFSENLTTVLIRNLFVYTFFPDFPERHPLGYILVMVALYIPFCWGVEKTLAQRMRGGEVVWHREDRTTAWIFLIVYMIYTAIQHTTKYVMEVMLQPLAEYGELSVVYHNLQYYLVGMLLLISTVMTIMLWHVYRRMAEQTEKEVIRRMASDRQAQYEFSRENIEMINRKSHDLKHQLRALAMVSDEERQRQIEEASRAIDFYDAVVKTGNEALDTLLTEKNVYCTNRDIRLSCMVNTRNLQKLSLVDLYTLLGNALDNAIESAERVSDPERKVISLSILDQGGMLYFQLENYFEGELRLPEGETLPQTRKPDQENHGYGLKSIRNIVHRYGGSLSLWTEGQIFNLEILIPA